MKLAACVILYNPDESVVSNIRSYCDFVDVVVAVDNSAVKNEQLAEQLKGLGNVEYISNGKNLGIAAALNIAAKKNMQDGYSWLLTMDQDSLFDRAEFELYKKQALHFFETESKLGLICPSEIKASAGLQVTEPAFRITSGTWINLDAWQKIGGFDERLFIDEVDTDFSCKLYLAGYRLIGFDNVMMQHKLGVKKRTGFLHVFFIKERTIHNPFRLYFMVRNYFVVRKRYAHYFPEIFMNRDRDFKIMLKNNIFFSENFFAAVLRAGKGFIHYKKNKF